MSAHVPYLVTVSLWGLRHKRLEGYTPCFAKIYSFVNRDMKLPRTMFRIRHNTSSCGNAF